MNVGKKVIEKIEELDRLGKERDDAWQIPRVEGELLHNIAVAARAKMIVEVGTSYGFSGLFWGSAMKHNAGHLHTIDKDPKKYDSSKLTFAQAELNDVITNHLGDAKQVLVRLPDGVDIAFIDADKPACRDYFDLIWPKMNHGGSIITDNAVTHREQLKEYITYLRSRDGATSCEVAIGNGIEWTIKLR